MLEKAIERANKDLATIVRYLEMDDPNFELLDELDEIIDKAEMIKNLL